MEELLNDTRLLRKFKKKGFDGQRSLKNIYIWPHLTLLFFLIEMFLNFFNQRHHLLSPHITISYRIHSGGFIFASFLPSEVMVYLGHWEEYSNPRLVWSPDQQHQYHLQPRNHPRPAESETLGVGPRNPCLESPLGDHDAHSSLRATAVIQRSVVKLMTTQGRNTESFYTREKNSIDSLAHTSNG